MRKYSQVFLTNEAYSRRIADCVGLLGASGSLVEIGPGRGAITSFLLEKNPEMTLVEVDPLMAGYLKENLKGRYSLINRDFLELDLASLSPAGLPLRFCGNLPYHISTAILEKIMDFGGFAGAVFMFQKEVTDKLCALPGEAEYGYLSALASVRADSEKLFDVSKGNFSPVPKVDSAVCLIKPKAVVPGEAEFRKYKKILGRSFAHRRKTLLNSISIAGGFEKETVKKLIEKAGIDPLERAEHLAPADFLKLASSFSELL